MNILLIGLGGSLGAISRYLLNEIVIKYIPTSFPTGILIVNIIGCLVIGLLLGNSMMSKDHVYYFFAVGFLGSFTTMSAFSYQTIELFNTNILIACSYIILTLTLTILATYIGINFSK
jgi:CrcB protein|tara:strand:+ start:616 stop:969 length:354 start_codon:yes stop_codon:yes gene_type:complete